MKRIAIIGAGQIGSRHLQALSNLGGVVRIELVDPSEESLRIARERFYEVYQENSDRIKPAFHRNIDDLSGKLDLAIIATCSDIRAHVIKELTGKKAVASLILEKVLFQTIDEYEKTDTLLKEKNIPAWVNCWMRDNAFFQKLRTGLHLDHEIKMAVEGSGWGMACNSIHYIDLFSYLTGCRDFHFDESHLERTIAEAKRPGFKEFFGRLAGRNSKGHSLTLSCSNTGPYSVMIRIEDGINTHEITDYVDHVLHKVSDGRSESHETVGIPFQSQTTHRLARQVIEHGTCDLPVYHDSMNLHIPLIAIFTEHMQDTTGRRMEKCPIT